MANRVSKSELAAWSALALAGGCFAGWFDLSVTAVQATALVLMVVNFALTLPGRAPAPLIAVLTSVGIPLVHAIQQHTVNPGFAIVLIPAFVAAYGGRFAGRLLETVTSKLIEPPSTDAPWYDRPLSTRAVLAVALTAIACAGGPAVAGGLEALGHRAPTWVAFVWQVMTWIGWVLMTPLVLAQRNAAMPSRPGVHLSDVIRHALMIVVLTVVHAAILLVLSAALFIAVTPSWYEMGLTAVRSYLPLDILAYLSILALAAASDVERMRRDSAQREAELRAVALDSRLTALRARLNPHFLFNALNSVHVLARGGKPDETVRVVEGLTELLRYVLDERAANVPLGDEMAFARRYLELQQVRFGTRLQYEITYDDSLIDRLVPQLLLQPIVENAVEHGVGRLLDGGAVRISASAADGHVRLIVDDDGDGPEGAGDATGIGLASTRERLATLYGDRARLTIGPHPDGRGTRVEIVIPAATA